MKKFIISCMSVVTLLFASCTDGDRIDQIDDSIPAPKPITVTSTRSIPGGAVIKVGLPNDANLKGVVAKYVRNGEPVETRISRYIDSLTVEGYANTDAQQVHIYAFNSNGNKGIACGLNNLQKIKEGEHLDGKTRAEDDFLTEEDDDFLA